MSTGTSIGPGVLSEAGGRVERDRSETQIGLNTHTLCICSGAVACSGLVWFGLVFVCCCCCCCCYLRALFRFLCVVIQNKYWFGFLCVVIQNKYWFGFLCIVIQNKYWFGFLCIVIQNKYWFGFLCIVIQNKYWFGFLCVVIQNKYWFACSSNLAGRSHVWSLFRKALA